KVLGVVTPLTALQWNDNLVTSPTGDVTQSVAGKILAGALARTKSPAGIKARSADGLATVARYNAIPADARVIANPKYTDFLLYDNQNNIREPLLAVFPDKRHAQMIVRLLGNESIKQEGKAADYITEQAKALHFPNTQITTTGAPALLENLN